MGGGGGVRGGLPALTSRTIKAGAVGLQDAADGSGAAGAVAGFSGAVVDLEGMLEVAGFALGVEPVADAGAAGAQGVLQGGVDGVQQRQEAAPGLVALAYQGA